MNSYIQDSEPLGELEEDLVFDHSVEEHLRP